LNKKFCESGRAAPANGASTRLNGQFAWNDKKTNRYRFWAAIAEVDGRFLRVITLEDQTTIHNAFLDRGFKP